MVELEHFDDDAVHRFYHVHNLHLYQEDHRPGAEVDLYLVAFSVSLDCDSFATIDQG